MKQQRLAGIESQKTEPMSLAANEMYHRLNVRYAKGDTRYTATFDEQLEDTKKVTLADVKGYYDEFMLGPQSLPLEQESRAIVYGARVDPSK